MSAFNSAAKTKPHLVKEHLSVLLPKLYQETVLKPELIRTVQMGPWTHKVDDGLDANSDDLKDNFVRFSLLARCPPSDNRRTPMIRTTSTTMNRCRRRNCPMTIMVHVVQDKLRRARTRHAVSDSLTNPKSLVSASYLAPFRMSMRQRL